MIERDDFIKAMIAAPDDDLPRLVFADWLEEQDEDVQRWRTWIKIRRKIRNAGLDPTPVYRKSRVGFFLNDPPRWIQRCYAGDSQRFVLSVLGAPKHDHIDVIEHKRTMRELHACGLASDDELEASRLQLLRRQGELSNDQFFDFGPLDRDAVIALLDSYAEQLAMLTEIYQLATT